LYGGCSSNYNYNDSNNNNNVYYYDDNNTKYNYYNNTINIKLFMVFGAY